MSVMFLLKKVIVFVNFSFKFFIRILSNPINDNPLRPRSETMKWMAKWFKGKILKVKLKERLKFERTMRVGV